MNEFWGNAPTRYAFEVSTKATADDIRDKLSELVKVPKNSILMGIVSDHTFCDVIDANSKLCVTEIGSDEMLVAFAAEPFADQEDQKSAHSIHCVINQGVDSDHENVQGFPILSSFPSTYSSKQVKMHVFSQLRRIFGTREETLKRLKCTDEQLLEFASENMTLYLVDQESFCKGCIPENPEAIQNDGEQVFAEVHHEREMVMFFTVEWTSEWLTMIDKRCFEAVTIHSSAEKLLGRNGRRGGTGSNLTLDNCFDAYTKPERLGKDEPYYCSRCKDHVQAVKTTKIRRLPNMMLISWKRFDNSGQKLTNACDFPIDGLAMSAHCQTFNQVEMESGVGGSNEVDATFDLVAVIDHYGRMNFGHYIAYARSWGGEDENGAQLPMDEHFYSYDDGAISKVDDSKELISSNAYCLMYRRRRFT
jgi:hypothetical protein